MHCVKPTSVRISIFCQLHTLGTVLLKMVVAGLLGLMLSACGSLPVDRAQELQINGMVIENQTSMWVSAVRLLVPVNGNFVSCGNIPPGTQCSTTFPESSYTGNPVEITWSQGGQIHSTGEFILQLPDDLKEDKPALVHVVIAGPASAGAMIIQK